MRAAVWVLLLVLMGWSAWQFSQPALAPQAHAVVKTPDISKIAAIELAPAFGAHVRLKKQDGTWMVAGSPANTESVQHLLDDLVAMRVIRVVTHTHTHDDALGINKGVKLTLLDQAGVALFTLTAGKQGSDLISTYVRIGQAAEVLAVDKSLVWQIKRAPDSWKAPSPKTDSPKKTVKEIDRDAKL